MSTVTDFFCAARWQRCIAPVLMFAASLCSTGALALATPTVTLSSAENPAPAGKGFFLTASVKGGNFLDRKSVV